MKLKNIVTSLLFAVLSTACGDGAEPKAPNGEACEVAEDCESFAVNEEIGGCWQELVHYDFSGESVYTLDNGMCSSECTWPTEGTIEEQTQGSCEESEVCLVYGNSESICFQTCSEEAPCREDYVCTKVYGVPSSTCLPPSTRA